LQPNVNDSRFSFLPAFRRVGCFLPLTPFLINRPCIKGLSRAGEINKFILSGIYFLFIFGNRLLEWITGEK